MVNLEDRFMIRDMYRKGISISAIARETGRDRKTIRKIIQAGLSGAGVANQAGYLVKRLRERAREAEAESVQPPVAVAASPVQAEVVQPVSTATPAPVNRTTRLSVENGLPSNIEWQMLAYSVTVACGCDLSLNPAAVQAVQRLHDAGYTAEDVGYFLKAYWPTIWPGNSGEPPTLAALLEHIGHAKHLLDMADGRSRGEELLRRVELLREHLAGERLLAHPDDLLPPCEGDPDLSPYAISGHPRFTDWVETERQAYAEERRQQRSGGLIANCPTCRRSREECICPQVAAIPGRIKDSWLALLGQLQIQLNRATYDSWLRRLALAGYADGELVIETPDPDARDWVERYLLSSMTRTFNDIYRRSPSDGMIRIRLRPKPAIPFTLSRLLWILLAKSPIRTVPTPQKRRGGWWRACDPPTTGRPGSS